MLNLIKLWQWCKIWKLRLSLKVIRFIIRQLKNLRDWHANKDTIDEKPPSVFIQRLIKNVKKIQKWIKS